MGGRFRGFRRVGRFGVDAFLGRIVVQSHLDEGADMEELEGDDE